MKQPEKKCSLERILLADVPELHLMSMAFTFYTK